MNNLKLFAESAVTSLDKKTITFFIVVFVIALILFAAIGSIVRLITKKQAERVDAYMYLSCSANVIKNAQDFIKFSRKKSYRIFYKESLIPFALVAVGVVVWAIVNWITGDWHQEIFKNCKDLIFIWDFSNDIYYTKVFGVTLLAEWPALLNSPHIEVDHIASYVEVLFIVTGIVWFVIVCQGLLVRTISTAIKAKEQFTHSLKDLKAAQEKAQAESIPSAPPAPVD